MAGWNLIVLATIVTGMARAWTRHRDAGSAFLAVYAGILVLWPWKSLRFLVPVLPLLLSFFLLGTWTVLRLALRGRAHRSIAWIVGALVALVWVYPRASRVSWAVNAYIDESPSIVDEREAARRLTACLVAHGTREDVLLSSFPEVIALSTGHPCVDYPYTRDRGALDEVVRRYDVKWILVADDLAEKFLLPWVEADPERFPLAAQEGPQRLYRCVPR